MLGVNATALLIGRQAGVQYTELLCLEEQQTCALCSSSALTELSDTLEIYGAQHTTQQVFKSLVNKQKIIGCILWITHRDRWKYKSQLEQIYYRLCCQTLSHIYK